MIPSITYARTHLVVTLTNLPSFLLNRVVLYHHPEKLENVVHRNFVKNNNYECRSAIVRTLYPSLSLSNYLCPPRTHALSLSLTHTRTHSPSHAHLQTHTQTLSPSHSHTLSPTLKHAHTLSLTPGLSILSLPLTCSSGL